VAASHIVVEGALYLLPALLLALALVAGHRPGERLVIALHRRSARRAGRTGSALSSLAPPRPAEQIFPRGGRLIAAALAGRAPPPACPAIHSS
jgi:hypothetical protein